MIKGSDSSVNYDYPDRIAGLAVCAACGCLCHDVDLNSTTVFQGCDRASHFAEIIRPRISEPAAFEPGLLDSAVQLFAEAVKFRRSITFAGLEHQPWEVQKAAITLAESVGAWVIRESDLHGSGSPWAAAFAQKGSRNASWSEIRLRSDALLLWYAPLWNSDPRWIERFGPRSERAHRLAIVTPDCQIPETGWFEEQLVRIDPSMSSDFIRAVRSALLHESIEPTDMGVRRVVHLIRNSHWLAVVRGEDPPGLVDPYGVAEALTDLIAEADGVRRAVITHVPNEINAAGLDAVLSMRSGIAPPMRFTAEGPVRGLNEWSIGHSDFVVAFSDRISLSDMNSGIRFVPALGPDHTAASANSGVVSIPVGSCGIESGGTIVRADGVAIRVPSVMARPAFDLVEFLRTLRETATRISKSDAKTSAGSFEPEVDR